MDRERAERLAILKFALGAVPVDSAAEPSL